MNWVAFLHPVCWPNLPTFGHWFNLDLAFLLQRCEYLCKVKYRLKTNRIDELPELFLSDGIINHGLPLVLIRPNQFVHLPFKVIAYSQ